MKKRDWILIGSLLALALIVAGAAVQLLTTRSRGG